MSVRANHFLLKNIRNKERVRQNAKKGNKEITDSLFPGRLY